MENIKKAIAFSIYGDNPKYLNGLLRNLKVSNFFYPGWIIYIYYNSSVPIEVINQIKNEKNIQLRDMSNSQLPCIMWRFLVNDELSVNAFIVRDADSRINIREAVAVHEWLNSTRKLHIMRDHPHHNFKILGGMWGLKNSRLNMLELINIYLLKCRSNYKLDSKMIDQDFLKDVIYKKYYFSKYIHASFHNYEFFSKNFTCELYDKHFVGEIFDENEIREYQYKLL